MTNTGANFAPTMVGYTGQKSFRFWCQTVLPMVYDDSLSYYELLCKVVNYLNNIISDVSAVETNVERLNDTYINLQNYVNNYFDTVDFPQLVDNKLDEMSENGSLNAIVMPILTRYVSDIRNTLSLLESRVDTLINPSITPTIEEVADIRVRYDGRTSYNAGTAVREQIQEIYSTLKTLNSYDITSRVLTKTTGTSNGITYTWNGDVCTVSGTSTNYSANVLRDYAPIPDDIIRGGAFYVYYQTTDPNIMLRIMWRDVNNTDISAEYLTANSIIRVPDNAAIWTIALYVEPDKVIDGAVVSGIAISDIPSQKDICNNFMAGKGVLETNTDLDTIKNEGHYLLIGGSPNYTYTNSPISSSVAGTLIVFRSHADVICQMVVSLEPNAKIYVRTSTGGTFSVTWKEIGDVSGVMQELSNYMTGKGVLETDTDLDTVKNEGHYLLIGGSPNYAYTNSPISSSVAGTLIVFRSHADVICQMVVSLEPNAKIYVRTSTGGTFSVTWKEIGDVSGVMQELGAVTREVYSTLKTLNAYDIINGVLTKTTGTSNGITYTWNDDVCTVSGTSANYSVNILRYYAPIPDDIIPGGTFYVYYQTTDPNIMLRIMWRDVNNTDILAEYLTANSIIRVPDNAAIWTIGLYVEPDKVIDEAVVSGIAISDIPSQKDISNNFMTGKGVLETNTDLDSVKNEGHYLLIGGSPNYTYTNSPISSSVAGTLIVFRSHADVICQMVVSLEPNAKIYVRTSSAGTFSAAWKEIGDVSGVMQELTNYMTGKGVLETNTDLDSVKNEGHYLLIGGSPNYTYTNSPVPSSVAGTLIVFKTHANVICQMVVSVESDAKIYVRTSTGGTFSMPWKNIAGSSHENNYITQHYENTYQITCTPTITTDTNQFLASTGDNTDRTGDIQAMLNAGYTCRLGPGRFVVTGIEIPDYGTLEGCTNSTMLLLADSVSTGYAVKLKSYSTIKNVRISGSSSAITLSSTVGTRHGILFEGTKRSGSTAGTTFYRSRIHQCQITSFTGGGITCTGTGVDRQSHLIISDCEIAGCNAGIYIPYYSEFHRITNCVVQDCYYGCVNNGGNNNFTNCDFSGNRVGLLIDNSTNQSTNNSHGTFSACSINHSYSDSGVLNQGTAIRLLKSNLGEIFTGMQIFYGAIELTECMGVRFIGANIGSKVPITVSDSSVISFSDCTFKDAPDSTDSPFTQSGNTALKFTDCYLHNGTVYNPV